MIPKSKKQLKIASLFSTKLPTLRDYDVEVRTGSVVWNRDERNRFSTRGRVSKAAYGRYPLIWSDCIGMDGTFNFERARKRAPKELFVGTTLLDPELISTSAIALKRTSNSNQSRRLFSAHICKKFVKSYGGYLGENHVNLIVPRTSTCTADLKLLSKTLNSAPVDAAFRCLSGSSAVSKYELNRLPLPDLAVVKKGLDEGYCIDEAVKNSLYE